MAKDPVYDFSARLFIMLRPDSGLLDIFPFGAPICEQVGHIYVPGHGAKQTILIDKERITGDQLRQVATRVAAASGFSQEAVLDNFEAAGGIELVMDKVLSVFAGPAPKKIGGAGGI